MSYPGLAKIVLPPDEPGAARWEPSRHEDTDGLHPRLTPRGNSRLAASSPIGSVPRMTSPPTPGRTSPHMTTLIETANAPAAPATRKEIAVAAAGIVRRYGEGESAVEALRGVSLELPAGQFTAVMGPSGSGKSTLMHILAGLDQPTAGSVEIAGKEISQLNDKQLTTLRRDHVGFVFQAFNLLPTLTAEENITLPLSLAGRKIEREHLDALIERVGLSDRRGHRPAEMSGGQQQRVAIARALASRPTVLFADEPTGNLDSTSGAEVLSMLRETVERDGQTILMVTHDPRAAVTADRVLFLADGRIVADLSSPTEDDVLATMKEITR